MLMFWYLDYILFLLHIARPNCQNHNQLLYSTRTTTNVWISLSWKKSQVQNGVNKQKLQKIHDSNLVWTNKHRVWSKWIAMLRNVNFQIRHTSINMPTSKGYFKMLTKSPSTLSIPWCICQQLYLITVVYYCQLTFGY